MPFPADAALKARDNASTFCVLLLLYLPSSSSGAVFGRQASAAPRRFAGNKEETGTHERARARAQKRTLNRVRAHTFRPSF